jgi:hypothetical protein
MGKRKDMTTIPLEELRHLDHAVFGNLIIARQSTLEVKEASMFFEKPKSERRKLKKTKSDNAMVLKTQAALQRSESLNTDLQTYRKRTTSNYKYSGIKYKDGENLEKLSGRQWRSAELPTMAEQRNMTGDYLNDKAKSSMLPTFTNGYCSLHCSASEISSLSASDSTEVLANCSRDLSISSRQSLLFHRSSSLSHESSIEEETEADDNSVIDENYKPRNESERSDRRHRSQLLDELLLDIYGKWNGNGSDLPFSRRRHSTNSSAHESDCCYTSGASTTWKIWAHRQVQGTNDLQRERLWNRSE